MLPILFPKAFSAVRGKTHDVTDLKRGLFKPVLPKVLHQNAMHRMNYLIYYRHCSTIIYSRFLFVFLISLLLRRYQRIGSGHYLRATRYMVVGFRFLENVGM